MYMETTLITQYTVSGISDHTLSDGALIITNKWLPATLSLYV